MDGMGLAGGFAEAAQGVMSGFQYARQQQALEQQRKQQELESAEARADAKMKRELLMKEIAAKEKAREIYAMDPKKDFGIDPKDFPNRDMYEAELSKRYAAEFRKAGIGEEAVKHESAGGQFYENGIKKASKKAFVMALSGDTDGAKKVLDAIGFNVDKIQAFKQKDGSQGFHIIDKIGDGDNAPEKIVSTMSAAELAGVMGDEDTLMSYLIKKDQQISQLHAELEAKLELEKRLKREGLGQYATTGQTVDPAAKKMQDEALGGATLFRTKDGTQIIVGEDLKITKGLLERGHSLASINKMRQRSGLPEIELRSMSKDEFETAKGQYSGLDNEDESSDSDIEAGSKWYGSLSQRGEGSLVQKREDNRVNDASVENKGNTGEAKTSVNNNASDPAIPPTPMNQPVGQPEKIVTYDKRGFTEEERKEFDDLYNRTNRPFEFKNSGEERAARKRYNELLVLGHSRRKAAQGGMGQNNPPSTSGR